MVTTAALTFFTTDTKVSLSFFEVGRLALTVVRMTKAIAGNKMRFIRAPFTGIYIFNEED